MSDLWGIQSIIKQLMEAKNAWLEMQLSLVPEGLMLCVHEAPSMFDPGDMTDNTTVRMTTMFRCHTVQTIAQCQIPVTKTIYQRPSGYTPSTDEKIAELTNKNFPHSKACGPQAHHHGKSCSPNCPTCYGQNNWWAR